MMRRTKMFPIFASLTSVLMLLQICSGTVQNFRFDLQDRSYEGDLMEFNLQRKILCAALCMANPACVLFEWNDKDRICKFYTSLTKYDSSNIRPSYLMSMNTVRVAAPTKATANDCYEECKKIGKGLLPAPTTVREWHFMTSGRWTYIDAKTTSSSVTLVNSAGEPVDRTFLDPISGMPKSAGKDYCLFSKYGAPSMILCHEYLSQSSTVICI